MSYPIKQQWIDGLPQIPYRGGVGSYEGVVMHYTDSPNDTAASERAYEVGHYKDAFVHEFIDPTEIIQVANPDYIAYGAGQFANARFVHLELCTAKNQDDFNGSFDLWCQRAAVHLANRTLGVSTAQPDGSGTLWGHFQVTQYLGATTHMDPLDYLQKWGKSWKDVMDRVQQIYDEITKGDEDNMPMKFEQWQWDMLYKVMGDAYNKDQIEGWDWMQKIVDKTLTAAELAFLNTVLDGRVDRKIEV